MRSGRPYTRARLCVLCRRVHMQQRTRDKTPTPHRRLRARCGWLVHFCACPPIGCVHVLCGNLSFVGTVLPGHAGNRLPDVWQPHHAGGGRGLPAYRRLPERTFACLTRSSRIRIACFAPALRAHMYLTYAACRSQPQHMAFVEADLEVPCLTEAHVWPLFSEPARLSLST